MVIGYGYFLYPPAWLGANASLPSSGDLTSILEVVAEADLSQGVRAKARRDGLFVFEVSEWPLGAPITVAERGDFAKIHERLRWRSALMNAHLACLYTAHKRIDHAARTPRVVGPTDLIPVEDTGMMSVSDAPHIGALMRLVRESPAEGDWRLARADVISAEAVTRSFDDLATLLLDADGQRLILADLALRSTAAHHAHSFDSSLIQSWALIEKLLTTLWEGYLDDNREREIDGTTEVFINADRRGGLTGRDYTISTVSDILSLLDRLPFEMYKRQVTVRRARNKWMHELKPVAIGESHMSLALALDLLRLVTGIDLDPEPDVMMMSGT